MVVAAIAVLLTAALLIMLTFSRRALKEEAVKKAEQTLEATVQQIDNIMLSVEQTTGNIYLDLLTHLDQPELMFDYSRRAVETNPYISGCAIAFEPSYYKDHGIYFMAYVHRNHADGLETESDSIIQAETFGNSPYNQQIWYTVAMKTGMPMWINPLKNQDTEAEAITTFSLPIYNKEGKKIGVMGADVSLALLTEIVQAAKPSPNSYATLLGSDGSYIVHPDSNKLLHHTVYTIPEYMSEPTVREASLAMVAGQTGYKHVKLSQFDSYVFYKPFTRSAVPGRAEADLGWSAGIIYPTDDIFGDYNRMLYIVIIIAVAGLLLLLVLCHLITHRQLLPLRMLSKSAQRIADGHFDAPVPDTRQQDEVGRLQNHFQQMQQALATNMGELERLNTTLKERGEVLAEAYEQAKEADRVKMAVLHNMTNQMLPPVSIISDHVEALVSYTPEMDMQEMDQHVSQIQRQGQVVTELLNDLLNASQEKAAKAKGQQREEIIT
ncbi:MAG: HAMP domain-containing protein [Prevotella sp.]|nr:HAMP domain-containing protein [Prevotella sp.]